MVTEGKKIKIKDFIKILSMLNHDYIVNIQGFKVDYREDDEKEYTSLYNEVAERIERITISNIVCTRKE